MSRWTGRRVPGGTLLVLSTVRPLPARALCPPATEDHRRDDVRAGGGFSTQRAAKAGVRSRLVVVPGPGVSSTLREESNETEGPRWAKTEASIPASSGPAGAASIRSSTLHDRSTDEEARLPTREGTERLAGCGQPVLRCVELW